MAKRRHQMRPESKWTVVGTETGRTFFVRLAPDFVNLEALGRPWGLSFHNVYEDYEEAHRYADSIDEFMDAVFAAHVANLPKKESMSDADWAHLVNQNGCP